MSSYEFPRSSPHAPPLFNSYNHLPGFLRVENGFSPIMCVLACLLVSFLLFFSKFQKVDDSFSILEYGFSGIGVRLLDAHLFVFLMVFEPYRSVQPSIVLSAQLIISLL